MWFVIGNVIVVETHDAVYLNSLDVETSRRRMDNPRDSLYTGRSALLSNNQAPWSPNHSEQSHIRATQTPSRASRLLRRPSTGEYILLRDVCVWYITRSGIEHFTLCSSLPDHNSLGRAGMAFQGEVSALIGGATV